MRSGVDIFPIPLKLQQQPCLIVGGGKIAYRKAQLLAKAGAVLDVLAPHIEPDLLALVKATGGQYYANNFSAHFRCNAYRLVIAATNDAQVNKHVFEHWEALKISVKGY